MTITPHKHSGSSFVGARVGLLGGSFNPAHEGHRAISLYAIKRLNLDQVWWLVSPQNPLKPNQGMEPFEKRLEKARAQTRHPSILVSNLESELGTRYTIDTLKALQMRFPRTSFVWLMGADNLQQLPRWKKWPEIFETVRVAVFHRPTYTAGYRAGKVAQRFANFAVPAWRAKTLMNRKVPAWVILDNQLNPLSATEIRKHKAGKE